MIKRPIALITAFTACATATLNGASKPSGLERQFRADIESIIRAASPSENISDDAVLKAVDESVADLKTQNPSFLTEDPKREAPADEALQLDYDEMLRVCGEPARTKIWMFYFQRWRSQRLTSDQRIIFRRLLREMTLAAERRKQEYEGSRKKG
jgi:hypothetical protein